MLRKKLVFWITLMLLAVAFLGCEGVDGNDNGTPSQSSTIQISENDELVFAVNKFASGELDNVRSVQNARGSLSIIQAQLSGQDVNTLREEIFVGRDPQSVSIARDGSRAFVSNGADNNVSVIEVGQNGNPSQVIATIAVGSEPRGTALTPNGEKLFVANFADGTVSVIDTENLTVIDTIALEFQFANVQDPIRIISPYAIAVTDDGDEEDDDETVYVSDFLARGIETIDIDQREGRNDGKEGRIAVFSVTSTQVEDVITLSPQADGLNGETAFPNQLYSINFDPDDNGRFYLPTIAAMPEAPLAFDSNVQAVVKVVNAVTNEEAVEESVNLNTLVEDETPPNPPFDANNPLRLERTFAGDTVAMAIQDSNMVFISRAGSFALIGRLAGNGNITVDQPAVRIAVGNIPNGVVLNSDASRAYVNAEVSATVTAIDLDSNLSIASVACADLPPVGSKGHQILIGKLAFYSGMGVAPEDLTNQDVRQIDTHRFRNVASKDNWSSCATCHPNGLSDGVTWIFATGPRQTIPLDGSFSPVNPDGDRRVLNWNAVRGSITDFNNNARNVQGGHGFSIDALRAIDDGQTPDDVQDARFAENHGPDENTLIVNNNPALNREGLSDSLNLMTLWVKEGIRTYNRPSNLNLAAVNRGRIAFEQFCAECHGGDKWTSSRILWETPLFFDGSEQGQKSEPVQIDTTQLRAVVAFDSQGNKNFDTPIIRVDLGTLFFENPIEKRANGDPSLNSSVSFNPPSLLGVANSAPYGHHGRAETLEEVFLPLNDDGLNHDNFGASQAELNDIVEFLKSIDTDQTPVPLRK